MENFPLLKNHFFKYRSLSNLRYFLDILINKRLYLATYTELNDPMEGAFVISGDGMDHHTLDLLRSKKNDLRICSLSKKYNNILMWAHYADSNKGCCIECEVTSIKDVEAVEVSYVPKIEPIGKLGLDEAAKLVLSRKLKCWKYEDEVRFMKSIPEYSRKSKFVKIKIHKIYLGVNVSSKDKAFYANLIRSIDSSIVVESMKRNDLSY